LPATKRNRDDTRHAARDQQLEQHVAVIDARDAPDEQLIVVDAELDGVVGCDTELDVAELFGAQPIEPERIVVVGNEQRDDE